MLSLGRPINVLVVDDDESIFDLVVDLLQATAPGQYQPSWTTSYDEALQALQNPAVDVALIDYRLGTTNGLHLISELTASPSNVPLILLTGQGGRELDSAALEAGATDYLDKATLSGQLLDRSLRYAIGRRRAAEALRRSDERFRALFANSPAAIYIAHVATGLVDDVNDEFEHLTGYGRAEVIGHSTTELGLWVDADVRAALSVRAAAGESVRNADMQMICKAGERRHVLVSLNQLSAGADTEPLQVAVLLDVTAQRALETQLRQAQKMEAVGQLAGGVAHDFNNALTAILGYSALALDDLPGDSMAGTAIGEVQKAGERAAALTTQLLAFSRRAVLEPSVINPNELVRNTETLLRRLIGTDMMLTLHLASNLSVVRADAALLEQAIVNLVLNAREAMPSGGHLDIETANVILDPAFAADHGVAAGSYVSIAVADTGTGMDETVKARVFEPFFTTKGPGEGSGLGLAMVYGAVTQSGGSISVQSQLGLGSTFTIYLPASDQPLTQHETRPTSGARGTETVLVVEDQDDVRQLVRELLHRSGYTVIAAADPHEALGILAQPHTKISLLLTDVVMPHMNGRELARICQARQPGLRVLYMSGYTNDALGQRGLLDPGIALIHKPFAVPVLLQRVRAVLDAPDRGTDVTTDDDRTDGLMN